MNIPYTTGCLFHLIAAKLTANQLKYREQAQQAYHRYFDDNPNAKHFKRFYYNTDSDTIIPRFINH